MSLLANSNYLSITLLSNGEGCYIERIRLYIVYFTKEALSHKGHAVMLREVQFTKIVWPTFLNSSEGLYYLLQLLVFVIIICRRSFRAEFFCAKLW